MASMTVGWMFAPQPRQSVQFCLDCGQLVAQRQRKEILCGPARRIVRTHLTPAAQHTVFVAWLRAEFAQTLTEEGDAYQGVRSGIQSELANNGGGLSLILLD